MFFTFTQNNSGGKFVLDKKNGLTHFVIIEAPTSHEAKEKAFSIGIYFNGVDEGVDCNCCGDRWYNPDAGDPVPSLYGIPIESATIRFAWMFAWMEKGHEIVVHYEDGRMEWHGLNTNGN